MLKSDNEMRIENFISLILLLILSNMKLFTNIGSLTQIRAKSETIVAGSEMKNLPVLNNAWMAVDNGRIHAFGTIEELDAATYSNAEEIDLQGRFVLPTWVDSHTHLVFAATRETEFEDRIHGMTYAEIAERGGGILNSAARLQEMSEDDLFDAALLRLSDVISMGTGAIEIKSGYGLTLEAEIKMLRVIKRLKAASPIPIKATFLGAHALPEAFKDRADAYVAHVINDMLPAVVEEGLADYIDLFCEAGYFTVDHCKQILDAGLKHHLRAKVHVNQFKILGAVAACVERNALSVDHLEEVDDKDLGALLNGNTIPVALPSCSFFLGIPYTPARRIIDAGLPLTLATDYNPGSTPSGNMNFVVSLACIKMGMTPNEAINAATLNGAAALELDSEIGSITVGKRANFIVTKDIENLSLLPYHFGESSIDTVYINGEKFKA
jgi:imidazolonepropionase